MDLAGNETVLIDQMLLDCCRLLLRSPGESAHRYGPAPAESAKDCRDFLEEQRTEPGTGERPRTTFMSSEICFTLANYRVLSKPKRPHSAAAWERLREDLVRPVVRHRLEAELLLVRSFVEDSELVAPSAESARAAGATDVGHLCPAAGATRAGQSSPAPGDPQWRLCFRSARPQGPEPAAHSGPAGCRRPGR